MVTVYSRSPNGFDFGEHEDMGGAESVNASIVGAVSAEVILTKENSSGNAFTAPEGLYNVDTNNYTTPGREPSFDVDGLFVVGFVNKYAIHSWLPREITILWIKTCFSLQMSL